MDRLRRLARDLGGIAAVLLLFALVTRLPPDTSLAEMRATGALRACVPRDYPPLVTGDPARPGIDIEILQALADRLGVELLLSPNDAMGRDFNPRHWAINRARCQVIAGGVVASPLTRSFLDTGPAYARTGWALLAPAPLAGIEGLRLGALTLVSGLDRIGLASYLRARHVTVEIERDAPQLVAGIAEGGLDGGVTEALLAGALAAQRGWWTVLLPEELPRYDLVLGLWKGDLTLKRAVVAGIEGMERDGTLAAIRARYGAGGAAPGTP